MNLGRAGFGHGKDFLNNFPPVGMAFERLLEPNGVDKLVLDAQNFVALDGVLPAFLDDNHVRLGIPAGRFHMSQNIWVRLDDNVLREGIGKGLEKTVDLFTGERLIKEMRATQDGETYDSQPEPDIQHLQAVRCVRVIGV